MVSGDTVSFSPTVPFRAGELIHITSKNSLLFSSGGATTPFSWVRQSAISNQTAAVFDTTGTGIILPAAAYGASSSFQTTMADFNRDGHEDVVFRYHPSYGASTNVLVYLRNANGTFAAPATYVNSQSHSALIGTPDLNNDGYPDLVISHNVPSRIHVRLNNGSGGFGAPTLYTVTDYCNGAHVYDIDRDGDLDVVAFSGNSTPSLNAINVLKNNGDGTFMAATTLTTNLFGTQCLPVDTNNDGVFELLYTTGSAYTGNPVFRVYANDGNANFSLLSSESNPNQKIIQSAFDYDANLSPDLITRNLNSEIHFNNAGLNYTLNSPTVFDAQETWSMTGDLDGDGDLDILSSNTYNGSSYNVLPMKISLNNGAGVFTSQTTSYVLPIINSIDLSDYDSDGDLDHLYLNPATGEVKVLLNNCNLITTLTMANSPLSGLYKAAQLITINGNVSIMPGVSVELKAPMVKVNQLSPGNHSNLIINPNGCN
ncbi:MAG: VCBS repeat-containing protein [Saprospiraceae bacterium]|nr:VCBS repeat-containing protein [Saprospiraceae bacterium]